MPIKPLGDRVLVQRLETTEEEKTSGGIYIPDTAKEKPQRGKVFAVGPGRMNDEGKLLPMNVKAGDGCSSGSTPEATSRLTATST